MARCEDWPCCQHEAGCCPDFDESGRQLNMRCVCGASVPLNSPSSLCSSCLNRPDPYDPESWEPPDLDYDEYDAEPTEEEREDNFREAMEDFGWGGYESMHEE